MSVQLHECKSAPTEVGQDTERHHSPPARLRHALTCEPLQQLEMACEVHQKHRRASGVTVSIAASLSAMDPTAAVEVLENMSATQPERVVATLATMPSVARNKVTAAMGPHAASAVAAASCKSVMRFSSAPDRTSPPVGCAKRGRGQGHAKCWLGTQQGAPLTEYILTGIFELLPLPSMFLFRACRLQNDIFLARLQPASREYRGLRTLDLASFTQFRDNVRHVLDVLRLCAGYFTEVIILPAKIINATPQLQCDVLQHIATRCHQCLVTFRVEADPTQLQGAGAEENADLYKRSAREAFWCIQRCINLDPESQKHVKSVIGAGGQYYLNKYYMPPPIRRTRGSSGAPNLKLTKCDSVDSAKLRKKRNQV